MILECPSCEKRYDLPVELPPDGRKVRCASCGHVWLATADDTVTIPAPKPTVHEVYEPENDIDFEDFEEDPVPEPRADASEDTESPVEESLEHSDTPEPQSSEFQAALEEESGIDSDPADDWSQPIPAPDLDDEDWAEADEPGDLDQEPMPPVEAPSREPAQVVIAKQRRYGLGTAAIAGGWILLAACVTGVLLLAYWQRVEVVRRLPGAAKVYARLDLPVNVRGLQFEKVAFRWSVDAGRPTLEVHGDIVNVTAEPIEVPTVVFALRNEANVEVYQWATDVQSAPLDARDRTRFVARIPTPPNSIRSVQLRFAKTR